MGKSLAEDSAEFGVAARALWAEIVRATRLEEAVRWLNDRLERKPS